MIYKKNEIKYVDKAKCFVRHNQTTKINFAFFCYDCTVKFDYLYNEIKFYLALGTDPDNYMFLLVLPFFSFILTIRAPQIYCVFNYFVICIDPGHDIEKVLCRSKTTNGISK